MSEPSLAMDAAAGNEGGAPVESSAPVENNDGGGHPAWAEVLEIVPEGLHGPLKERLGKWDQNVQNLVQKVHSEYEPFKPFKEQGINPEELSAAYQLFQMANANPRALYDQLGEYFGFPTEQGQQEQTPSEEEFNLGEPEQPNFEQNPAFQQLAQQQQMLMEHIAQQQYQQQLAEADNWLDSKINSLPENVRGDKNAMNYILNVAQVEAQKTGDFDKAFDAGVAAFNTLTGNLRSAPRAGDSAPLVVPGNGGVPASKNPADMDDAERRQAGVALIQGLMKG